MKMVTGMILQEAPIRVGSEIFLSLALKWYFVLVIGISFYLIEYSPHKSLSHLLH